MAKYRDINVNISQEIQNLIKHVVNSEQSEHLPASCLAGDNASSC